MLITTAFGLLVIKFVPFLSNILSSQLDMSKNTTTTMKVVMGLVPEAVQVNPPLKDGKKKRVKTSCGCRCRIPKSSGILTRIGVKVAKALNFMSDGKKCSRKVSSTSTTTTTSLTRSRSYVETCLDSQRAEAIEDCIEFLNSSFTLQRSNSIKSSC